MFTRSHASNSHMDTSKPDDITNEEWNEYWKTCLLCGHTLSSKNNLVSRAHLVSTTKQADSTGEYNFLSKGYKEKFSISQYRAFIPLCGTLGAKETCHHFMDNYWATILWNPFKKEYVWYLTPDLRKEHSELHLKQITSKIFCKHPAYRRILAARAVAVALKTYDKDLLEHPCITLMSTASPPSSTTCSSADVSCSAGFDSDSWTNALKSGLLNQIGVTAGMSKKEHREKRFRTSGSNSSFINESGAKRRRLNTHDAAEDK